MLEAHIARLCGNETIRSAPTLLHAVLFLPGLRAAFLYYQAAERGEEAFTHLAPIHHLDDGLRIASRPCLVALLRSARSQKTAALIRSVPAEWRRNPNWLAVKFAFAGDFKFAPPTVSKWLQHGDCPHNKLRLSCGMGVEALWASSAVGFIHKMMRDPFDLPEDTAAAISSFVLTARTMIPEIG